MASGEIIHKSETFNISPYFKYEGYNLNDINSSLGYNLGFCLYNADTLNSPYKAGVSQSTMGIVLASGSNYGFQVAFPYSETNIYIRNVIGGTWGSWRKI